MKTFDHCMLSQSDTGKNNGNYMLTLRSNRTRSKQEAMSYEIASWYIDTCGFIICKLQLWTI